MNKCQPGWAPASAKRADGGRLPLGHPLGLPIPPIRVLRREDLARLLGDPRQHLAGALDRDAALLGAPGLPAQAVDEPRPDLEADAGEDGDDGDSDEDASRAMRFHHRRGAGPESYPGAARSALAANEQ
jgi:hypothetical protein